MTKGEARMVMSQFGNKANEGSRLLAFSLTVPPSNKLRHHAPQPACATPTLLYGNYEPVGTNADTWEFSNHARSVK